MEPLLDKLLAHEKQLDELIKQHEYTPLYGPLHELRLDTWFMIGYVQKHIETRPEWEAFIIRMSQLRQPIK